MIVFVKNCLVCISIKVNQNLFYENYLIEIDPNAILINPF